MSKIGEQAVRRANGEASSAKASTPTRRPSSPRRKARVILQGLWQAAHDFNVAYKMVVSALVLVLAAVAWKWLDLAVIGVATGLLLTSELFNTAVERLCDFVQPDYDERIGCGQRRGRVGRRHRHGGLVRCRGDRGREAHPATSVSRVGPVLICYLILGGDDEDPGDGRRAARRAARSCVRRWRPATR